MQKTTLGFDGRTIRAVTGYDTEGRVASATLPYFDGDPVYTQQYAYDVLGRITKETRADGSQVNVAYGVMTTITTNDQGQTSTKIKNSQGQLIKSIDSVGNFNTYAYDAIGNTTQIVDANGNLTTLTYDIRGNKTAMVDPNMGSWKYQYNTLGQLVSQTDAKNNVVSLEYDLLGRLVKRTELEGISAWVYDTATKGIGKLARVTLGSGLSGYLETYSYDALGRPQSTQTTIGGLIYAQSVTYDAFSRPATTTLPTGLVVKNIYNTQGFLAEVRNGLSNVLYWQAVAVNARGQTVEEKLGNGLSTLRAYNNTNGLVQGISTGNGAVQNLSFQFDSLGNLTQRQDINQSLTETFSYDALNRLTAVTLNSLPTKTYQYDKVGNITSKSDMGSYLYQRSNGAGPNAVTQVNTRQGLVLNYVYDANGNQTSGDGRILTYTSFNKPKTATKGTTSDSFGYGPSRERITKSSKVGTVTTTTTYVGKVYERVNKSGSTVTEHKHYIAAGGTTVVVTQRSNNVNDIRYLHQDHLGSVNAITNETGLVVERNAFDPWGARRQANWKDAINVITSLTTRGFTGHEHDDELGLINMNARMYDPKLGRFLQPDSYIQFPETTQGFNRYTYVNNNPLSYMDPSGNFIWGFVFAYFAAGLTIEAAIVIGLITASAPFKRLLQRSAVARTIVSVIAAAYGDVYGATLWAGYSTDVLGGSTKDIARAMATSYVSGLAFNQAHGMPNETFGQQATRVVAHGTIGGGVSAAQGGKFAHGFVGAAFSQTVSLSGFYDNFSGNRFAQSLVAGVVGGGASVASGGKFESGATAAVFGHLFNDLLDTPAKRRQACACLRLRYVINKTKLLKESKTFMTIFPN